MLQSGNPFLLPNLEGFFMSEIDANSDKWRIDKVNPTALSWTGKVLLWRV